MQERVTVRVTYVADDDEELPWLPSQDARLPLDWVTADRRTMTCGLSLVVAARGGRRSWEGPDAHRDVTCNLRLDVTATTSIADWVTGGYDLRPLDRCRYATLHIYIQLMGYGAWIMSILTAAANVNQPCSHRGYDYSERPLWIDVRCMCTVHQDTGKLTCNTGQIGGVSSNVAIREVTGGWSGCVCMHVSV